MLYYAVWLVVCHSAVPSSAGSSCLQVLYEWKTVDYVWPSSQARDVAIQNGSYVAKNVPILDVDVYEGSASNKTIFVTTPIFNPGIPATLSTLSSEKAADGSTLLEPFPNWASNVQGNCDGLTSVYRVYIDPCGKLWVLDTGKVDTFAGKPRQLCPPQIVIYDLKQGKKEVARHKFPTEFIAQNTLLITIVVDTRDPDKCSKQYAYIADVNAYKMLVYDAQTNESWQVSSNYFYASPLWGTFDIVGTKFDLMDGLFSMSLSPVENDDRTVYFHALGNARECWIKASTLLNKTAFQNNPAPTPLFHTSDTERISQSSIEVMTNEGVMFFPLVTPNSLVYWNTTTPYKNENFVTVYQNDETFQFISGMKLIHNKQLYMVSTKLQNYIVGKVDTSKVVYRILSGAVADLTKNSQIIMV